MRLLRLTVELVLLALALLTLTSCSTTTNQQHMVEHFDRSDELVNAVVRGDLEAARPAARWLAEHDHMDLPPSSVVAREGFRSAAREVSEAQDLDGAASAAARTARACGTCHEELGGPQPTAADPAPDGRDLASHMARHSWALNQMWNGLTGPSEASWQGGAETLRGDPLDAWTLESPLDDAEHARELADRVHRVTAQLDVASGWGTRTTAFGLLLGTCAHCHQAHLN